MSKDSEYMSLRAEIISLVEIQYNYIIAMYTITIAIISLAIQQKNEWLFLLPYIILISFQRVISAKRNVMLRIAAYIAVFLDEDIGWEKNYNEIVNHTLNKHNDKEKFSKLKNVLSGRISSLQLGVVCSTGCIVMRTVHVLENKNWNSLDSIIWNDISFFDIFPVFCAILLLASLIDWCKDALKAPKIRDLYIESLITYKNELNQN